MGRNKFAATVTCALMLGGFALGANAGASTQGGDAGKVTIFLSDPDLGVVGSYIKGNDTIYFEARNGRGDDALSVRLLDAGGRTIAIAGHSMDDIWHLSESLDPKAAASSQSLALPLAAQLGSVLDDPAFDAERTALSSLAFETAGADLSVEMQYQNLAKSVPLPASAAIRENFYQRAVAEVSWGREKKGDMGGTFRATRMQALQLDFPTELNEEGTGPRIEIYTRLASADGSTLSGEFGGDVVPDGWWEKSDESAVSADMNARLAKLGEATMAAHIIGRYVPKSAGVLPALTAESFDRLANGLRDNLLPRTDETKAAADRDGVSDKAGGTWTTFYNKSTNSQIWRKWLVWGVAEHSSNLVGSYVWPSPSSYYLHHNHVFCNHGGCPNGSGMALKCQFSGNFHSGFPEPPAYYTQDNGPTWHSCQTPYVVGSTNGGHNCNDDTMVQLFYTNLQNVGTTGGQCANGTIRNYAPSCTDSGAPR